MRSDNREVTDGQYSGVRNRIAGGFAVLLGGVVLAMLFDEERLDRHSLGALAGAVVFIVGGFWYLLRGPGAEPWVKRRARNTNVSMAIQIVGAINVLVVGTAVSVALFSGHSRGHSLAASAATGLGIGLLAALAFSVVFSLVRAHLAARRETRRIRAALAAKDYAEVERLLIERWVRAGFSEAYIRESLTTASRDVETRLRSRIAPIEAILQKPGPLSFSAQRRIRDELAKLGSSPSEKAGP